jgi:putative YphP/YqiW family bacilliredoxin
MYDPQAVQFMRDELTYVGFEEMRTPEEVKNVLSQKNDQTVLVFINSVCGCAAGSARPGVSLALQHNIIPDKLTTVFAGQDRDAVDFVRQNYLSDYPPSSPSLALIKNGEPIYMMQRHQIEGESPNQIAEKLIKIFDHHCGKKGPSIPKEKYDELVHAKACGSKMPVINN